MAKKLDRKILATGWKAIVFHLRSYRREVALLLALTIISSIANGVIPYLVGRLIDAITALDPKQVYLFLAIWLAVQLVAYTIDWFSSSKRHGLGGMLYGDYLVRGYSYLLKLPMSFHKKYKVGEISNKIQRSADVVQDLAENVLLMLAPQFLSIITALTLAFIIQPRLGWVILAGLIVYIIVFGITVMPLAALQLKVRRGWNRAFGTSHDAIFNIKAVKEATTEDHEARKMYRDFHDRAVLVWLKLTQIWQNLSFYQRLTILGTQLAIFLYSIILIRAGTMTVGELVSFNAYAALVFGPFTVLANNWIAIQNGLIILDSSEKILSTETETYVPAKQIKINQIDGNISIKNVDFYYDRNKPVLKNINFEVKAGEVVALVGESGVGKSTLIDLISGYHFAKKGTVLIDGHNIKNIDLNFLRSQIAVVPQEVVLFNDTIKTNIRYGNFKANQKKIELAATQAHALEFIEKFPQKWKQVVGERGVKLSVGQKQRVAIARAILRQPKILILDEPTSALDAKSEQIISQSLNELMQGRTTFIIAHRLSTVRKADKILVFKDGEVVERGKHDDLIQIEGGVYRHLYELQIGLHT